MDKYNAKTSFQKWFSAVNFEELSAETQNWISQFDAYSKKLDFTTAIKILLHAVYEELPGFRKMDSAFIDRRLCEEIGIDSLCYSSLSRKTAEISQEVLMEIFIQLTRKAANERPSSKTTSLQLVDSTTIPLNKTCLSNFCEISAYFRRSCFFNTVYSEKGDVTRLLSRPLLSYFLTRPYFTNHRKTSLFITFPWYI
ncbi:hypothetical protein [Enterococcus canis]|uniref:hypothetical protein n=1 Tax=Enterococcus canis TaxID=214095 RepID=UPI00082EE367|nr:hypothetical protein [Enterococcus canis]